MGRKGRSITVIVRGGGERAREAFRVAAGLSVMDDEIRVYIVDPLGPLDDIAAQSLEALAAMGVPVHSACDDGMFPRVDETEVHMAALSSDVTIPY